MTSPQPPISPGPGEPYSLGNLMPAPSAPAAPAIDLDAIVARETITMQAAGWQLYQRWPGGADFTSITPATISTGVHLILTVFTLGAWLVIWVLIEIFGGGGSQKWCRLIVGEDGKPQFSEIGRPK